MDTPIRELGGIHSGSSTNRACDGASAHVESLAQFSHLDCASESPGMIGKKYRCLGPHAELRFQLVWGGALSEWKSLSCAWLFATPCIVHGILQARILEWVAVSFFRGSSQPRELNPGHQHCRWILYQLSHQGNLGWSINILFFLLMSPYDSNVRPEMKASSSPRGDYRFLHRD